MGMGKGTQCRAMFTLCLRDRGVCECKMDIKFTWILMWPPMEHVSWSLGPVFKNHLLEIGLKQNQKIVELRTLATIIDFIFYFLFLVMVEEPHD